MEWKKHKKKILVISLILLVYSLIIIGIIPLNRGNIDFGSVSSIKDCYNAVNARFNSDDKCWFHYPYKNFIWRLDKVWETEKGNCLPCHTQNSIFQNCVKSLKQGYNVKTKIGFCYFILHIWSEVDGIQIDIWGADHQIEYGETIYTSEICGVVK